MTRELNGPVVDGGFTRERAWFKGMPTFGDPDYIFFRDDFMGIAIDVTNDWTLVEDSSSTQTIEADTLGGRLQLFATADDEGTSLQGNEIFQVSAGIDTWFEIKLACNEPTEVDLCFGLTVNFATNPEAMLTAADRIVFQKDDGTDDIYSITEFSGDETKKDTGIDLGTATDITLGFRVFGDTSVVFYVNRVAVATHTSNIVTDQNLALGMMMLCGDAADHSIAVDYIQCIQTR